jgi:hypothetical protein
VGEAGSGSRIPRLRRTTSSALRARPQVEKGSLLAAEILSALWPASLLLGLAGLAGVTYMLIVLWLARNRLDYQPVLFDWLWYMSCLSSPTPRSSIFSTISDRVF